MKKSVFKSASKYLIVFLTGALFATAGTSYAANLVQYIKASIHGDIKISVNGKEIDAAPIVYNSSTYLPVRKISDAIGGKISFSDGTKKINISVNQTTPAPAPTPPKETTNSETNNIIEMNEKFLNMKIIKVGDQTYFSNKDFGEIYLFANGQLIEGRNQIIDHKNNIITIEYDGETITIPIKDENVYFLHGSTYISIEFLPKKLLE